jgi:hypothetical protein
MEKDKLLQAIDNHLEDIREQFTIIREYEGKIPGIELDIIMSNIRKVYEVLLQLEKTNRPVVAFNVKDETNEEKAEVAEDPERKEEEIVLEKEPETIEETVETPVPEEVTPEPVVEEKIPEPVPEEKEPEPAPEPIVEVKEPEKVVVEDTPPITTEMEPEKVVVEAPPPIEEKPRETMTESVATEVEVEQPKTTLDLFGESSDTLADRLTDNSEKRVADKLQGEKVNDLKAAIGINEKFSFINELFDGSLKNYEDAIARLNHCGSVEEAGKALDELQSQYSWDAENSITQSFIDLVYRKF